MEPTERRKPQRLDQLFYDSPLYFVTFCTMRRLQVLACTAAHESFIKFATHGLEMKLNEVGRYVLMPDHVHLFVRGLDTFDLSMWTRGLKRAIGKTLAPVLEPGTDLWQPGFFDHVLRNNEIYEHKWDYVRLNPVRAGLVTAAEDWPYQGEIARIDRL